MIRSADDPRCLAEAAEALARGELVAFPTETVYGLGARADVQAAVEGVFSAKGRPRGHPLIVHVADAPAARPWAAAWPPEADRLAGAFWPGPLTLILPRAPGWGAAAAGGQTSIGLRCPDHPSARALLAAAAALGVPGVAAPSANRFGRVSPTTAAHVQDEFGESLLILDGGPCEGGIESTIVDLTGPRPVARRPGILDRRRIEAVLGVPLAAPERNAPRASGDLESHYAPRARVELWSGDALQADLDARAAGPGTLAVYSRRPLRAGSQVVCRSMPDDPAAAAHELFSVLRALDAAGVSCIRVEAPPPDAAWDGVRDRLQRAAAPRS